MLAKVSMTTREQERAEVEAILASEMFRRAPNLLLIISYICEQYFAGEAADIKEYNIAVEALGRDPSFDPSANSIVRVEASRLRRRLREYYATEGAGRHLQLMLPNSGYVPQFLSAPAVEVDELEPHGEEGTPPIATKPVRRTMWLAAGGIALVIVVALGFLISFAQVRRSVFAGPLPGLAVAPTGLEETSSAQAIRILAGFSGAQFLDSLGHEWSGDRYFTGGKASESLGDDILGVLDPTIYHTARSGNFRYDIPLQPGSYELRLLFVERIYGQGNRVYAGEGSRVFHVSINGVRVITGLDILADVGGPNIPADRAFNDISPASDGYLHLEFTPVNNEALLNGIEIQPSKPGKMLPVRIVAGGRSYHDREGRFWGSDRYFIGGRPFAKRTLVEGTNNPELYRNERWGHFSYSIPVPSPGRYKATLKFAETNFARHKQSSWTGADRRIFDVYCNGTALLRNFEILKEVGENRAIDKIFRGLTPNAQGRLVFSFVPVKEYATVRAIEVVDDSR